MIKSFAYACQGLWDALMSERNFRIQWLCGLMVFMLNGVVVFEPWQQIVFVLLVFLVLALELYNSALEKTCDSSGLAVNPHKKRAKDFAAASVLVLCVGAAVIGVMLMSSKWPMLDLVMRHEPWLSLAFVLLFIVTLPLVIYPKKSLTFMALALISALACAIMLQRIYLQPIFAVLALLFYSALLAAIFHAKQEL